MNLIPKIFAFWDNDLLDFDIDNSYGNRKYKTPEEEYLALKRAVELDGEWHKGVTALIPTMVLDMTGDLCNGGRPIPVSPSNQKSSKSFTSSYRNPAPYPCHQCGLVVQDLTQHIINQCDKFIDQGRYAWRRQAIIHYFDSLMDHNNFRIFCDIPDRRTSTGMYYVGVVYVNIAL